MGEKEFGHLEVLVQDRPGKRHVEHLLCGGRARTGIAVVSPEVIATHEAAFERMLAALTEAPAAGS